MTKRSFTGKDLRAKVPLELVHSDLYRPMNVKARVCHEFDSLEKFKEYKAKVENELELREPRRSGRIVHQPDLYLGLTETQVIISDYGVKGPLTYKQAVNDVERDWRMKSMDLEMETIYFNSV
ncbi:gag/pol protein [Cucumis melo var. makuwa]|uniref:Gag/pol protein n=1 Tax=Cucumis melo var. makuwa TaxID=1194695 RepID=A0A5D3D7U3_CUCMM|nr:gag/pol protein [Cucumis melo var. makuwa]TYK19628.1 gag/pol protein [Cucumis melo var. makuwa]